MSVKLREEKQARIITPQELEYPRKLPLSWTRAAGLLRHRRRELFTHLRRARKEWSRER